MRLGLWTLEHWQPPAGQPRPVLDSNLSFWTTVGSFAVPLLILAQLVLWLDRRGLPVPAFIGWSLAAWLTVAALVIEPSGFPVGVAAAGCLIVGSDRQGR
ncbi:hypothetical protein E8M01_02130 [Phreatobacter stygius]|uniref:Uncharacterized protein n=1 Tax=Phreatobacter stygius TaxID=1940610 RepID=A0A4D7BMH9_9HYPH|nr:hypothetical protein E8M01_02130 [Phreatobacter stygius]